MSDFANKSVVVTGGAKGIGSGIVRAFAMAGARVACVDTDEVAGQQISGEAEGYSGDIRFYRVDVSEGAECASLCKSVISDFGSIDVLCNNVGIQPTSSYVAAHELPDEMWDQIIDVNLKSHFLMSKYSLPHMIEAESGVIINTASVQGLQSAAGVSAYAASKGGIIGLTLPMARDLAPLGIRVNTIAPGVMGTPMLLAMPEKVQDALSANVQFPKRLGLPEEFAKLVIHMANNSYLNGETIRLDGGLRMPPK